MRLESDSGPKTTKKQTDKKSGLKLLVVQTSAPLATKGNKLSYGVHPFLMEAACRGHLASMKCRERIYKLRLQTAVTNTTKQRML